MPDIEEMNSHHQLDGNDPYRVYRFRTQGMYCLFINTVHVTDSYPGNWQNVPNSIHRLGISVKFP